MRRGGIERSRAGWRGVAVAIAAIALGPAACTDGRTASPAPAVPRNSDGSPQVLPPGPPSRSPHTIVLAYDDFGPQVMSFELIGMGWWQWEGGGSWEPGDRFDIRVVVYRGRSLAAVQAEYPTVEGKADYRYVSYDDAMAYFERSMAEIEGEPSLARLHGELAATRARIRQALDSS